MGIPWGNEGQQWAPACMRTSFDAGRLQIEERLQVVIPAQAGIQRLSHQHQKQAKTMDSRLRGHDEITPSRR